MTHNVIFNTVVIPKDLTMQSTAEGDINPLLTELPDPNEINILNLESLTFQDGDFSQCQESEKQEIQKVCKQKFLCCDWLKEEHFSVRWVSYFD